MSATILHADLDAFYASVEQLLDPSLRGKPIAVGGGVVLAASYEAKAFGVKGGMPGRKARELCPHLIFVGGHFKQYQQLGDAAMKVLDDFTPCQGWPPVYEGRVDTTREQWLTDKRFTTAEVMVAPWDALTTNRWPTV